MQFFSFRNKLRLRKYLTIVLIVLAAIVVFSFFYLLYMDRYIVYQRDGAHVDTKWSDKISDSGEKVLMSVTPAVTELEKTNMAAATTSRKLSGVYITLDMLADLPAVRSAVSAGNYRTVMIEMKDGFGNYCYTSSAPDTPTASIDIAGLRAMIADLKNAGVYLIASIPAFADQYYCLNHVDLGLPLESGALWVDSNYCYWMDPAKTSVLSYIESACRELSSIGFQEIMLSDYYIPTDPSIVYDETLHTRLEVLANAAQTLQSDLASEKLTLSFGIGATGMFPLTLSAGRLYMAVNDSAAAVSMEGMVREYILSPEIQIVFMNNSPDTRFDDYGHLKPLPLGG